MNKFKENKNMIIGICIGILLVLLCFTCYKAFKKPELTEYEKNVNAITEISEEDRQEQINQIVEDGQINIQYSLGAVFNGKKSESFNVKNIENNKDSIKFTLYDENDKIIYESKEIERGYEVNSIELDKGLSNGIHNCKISIGYVNEGNVYSTFPITIEVK